MRMAVNSVRLAAIQRALSGRPRYRRTEGNRFPAKTLGKRLRVLRLGEAEHHEVAVIAAYAVFSTASDRAAQGPAPSAVAVSPSRGRHLELRRGLLNRGSLVGRRYRGGRDGFAAILAVPVSP
jgi:hypothetical protein